MRNFLQYPFAPYKGSISSKAVRANGRQCSMVLANILWSVYTVGGSALGNDNPNFTVNFELQGVGPNVVSQQWIIQSVYIDNENVGFPVYVFFPDTQFAVSCPPNSSGWYQVFTNGRSPRVVGIGITDSDIATSARTGVYFTDALMTPYLDQEIASAVDLRLASPTISLGGTGGGIQAIQVLQSGSSYTGTGMTIVGGGGIGAAATAVLDAYGRIASVTVTNPGSGYTGVPLIGATGARTLQPAWVAGVYNPPSQVNYGGVIYQCIQNTGGADDVSQTPPNLLPAYWQNTGLLYAQVATFNATLNPIIGGSTVVNSSLYGPTALGDQTTSFSDQIVAGGVFRNNLFNTPFNNGFIHLTHIYVGVLKPAEASTLTWVLDNDDSDVLYNFTVLGTSNVNGPLLNIQGANIKLDARKTWRLKTLIVTGGLIAVSHAFVWTYNQF